MKLIKNRIRFTDGASICLLLSFIVPSVLQAAHYSFIEHSHYHVRGETTEINIFHTNCELDDYSFGQSDDIQQYALSFLDFIGINIDTPPPKVIVFVYRICFFLLRAPPCL